MHDGIFCVNYNLVNVEFGVSFQYIVRSQCQGVHVLLRKCGVGQVY